MKILFFIIFITLLISFLSMDKIDSWYLDLNKSSLTPPGYIFSIVWPILYILMSISVWIIWNKEKEITFPIQLYIIQLILNFTWSPLFFKYHCINESLFLLLLIWILVFIIIDLFYSIDKIAGLLLIPYLIWLTFAFYLNYYIVKNN
jgi:tryptophan-rich sensory protein